MARYEKNTPRKTEGVFAYPEYKKPVGRLSLGELRSATSGFEAVFLTLFHSWVAGEQACFFQHWAHLVAVLQLSLIHI